MVCVEAHVHFIIFEILKNSMRATLDHHGSSSLPKIIVDIDFHKDKVFINIKDQGGGIPGDDLRKLFWYFFSSVPKTEPTYTYSGLFGTPFSGMGCGLPLSRVYCWYMGGDIRIESEEGKYTNTIIELNKLGNNGDVDLLTNFPIII